MPKRYPAEFRRRALDLVAADPRMSRVPWNFGGGPMIIRLRSRSHHDSWHRQSARRHAARGRLAGRARAGGRWHDGTAHWPRSGGF